jgi:hypothetical protein
MIRIYLLNIFTEYHVHRNTENAPIVRTPEQTGRVSHLQKEEYDVCFPLRLMLRYIPKTQNQSERGSCQQQFQASVRLLLGAKNTQKNQIEKINCQRVNKIDYSR